MVNYQLRNLRKYYGKTLFIYNWSLRHEKKGIETILNLKAVSMIYSVAGWYEITQYDDKSALSITNSVETTWLTIYHIPMEITYGQRS